MKNITKQRDFATKLPKAILSGFRKTDKCFLDKMESGGSTAIVAMIDTNNSNGHNQQLYIANVGDSRAVACVDGKAVPLSTDHKVYIFMLLLFVSFP